MNEIVKEKYVDIDVFTTQKLIKEIKDKFQNKLAKSLNLLRVSAPLFLDKDSGLSDDLSGVERKVEFSISGMENKTMQVVQSLAKWKRVALKKYNFSMHCGLYTDMSAIRKCECLDALHSAYVDQYDWELIIESGERNINYLKSVVTKIANNISNTSIFISKSTNLTLPKITSKVHFITSQKLLDLYPNLTPKQREYEICKKYKCVFIIGIGYPLSDLSVHDMRSPDYDDWNLNGDLLYYHEVLDCALEVSSMGIRVDSNSLLNQLRFSNTLYKSKLPYHSMLLNNELPLTIGGGIGQSRLCMLLLGRVHIGQVQASEWTDKIKLECEKNHITLL